MWKVLVGGYCSLFGSNDNFLRDHLPSSLKLKVPVRAHSGVNPHASGPTASQPPTSETLGGTKTTINEAAK